MAELFQLPASTSKRNFANLIWIEYPFHLIRMDEPVMIADDIRWADDSGQDTSGAINPSKIVQFYSSIIAQGLSNLQHRVLTVLECVLMKLRTSFYLTECTDSVCYNCELLITSQKSHVTWLSIGCIPHFMGNSRKVHSQVNHLC